MLLVAALVAAALVEAAAALAHLVSMAPRRRLIGLHERADLARRAPWLVRPLDRLAARLDPQRAPTVAGLLVDLEAMAAAGLALGALAAGASGSVVGAALPLTCRLAWLRERAHRREARVRRDLPLVLDLLAMAVEGGLAAGAALDLAARRGPTGPLRDGLGLVVAGMAAGRSRADALAELRRTLPYPEIAALVATLDQTDRLGGRLAPALRMQAEQRRQERWHAAERRALLAPVRLLLPLALCILPATFVVLLVPLVLRLSADLVP